MNSNWKDRFSWETLDRVQDESFLMKFLVGKILFLGPSESPISLLTATELEKIFENFGSNLSVSDRVIKNIGLADRGKR